jgi:hypothetical protein
MRANSAVVLSIDRLGAGWLGSAAMAWLKTLSFNRPAAQSLPFGDDAGDSASIA